MTETGTLAGYRGRRDFEKTAEPEGGSAAQPADGPPSYVVQIHDARSMHVDVRLEADGVLRSFAVPKGPSRDPHDKRFATPTEDHPLEYRAFEGVIAEGEYGGGTVIVRDEGTYRNATKDRRGPRHHRPAPRREPLARPAETPLAHQGPYTSHRNHPVNRPLAEACRRPQRGLTGGRTEAGQRVSDGGRTEEGPP
ncbi:DNA polymerase ligase N-terminal domain-containing protein [Streptomyces aureus]|uniref:DNA polymerase ligase N-terminal domain-containing protein n=1 Tax=Streptomyces aureus TaxID=193461 RepID=UPI0006E17575|nr:DNA polymerase ligase N-terminal domain-containing protein [Streptomyces aureus]